MGLVAFIFKGKTAQPRKSVILPDQKKRYFLTKVLKCNKIAPMINLFSLIQFTFLSLFTIQTFLHDGVDVNANELRRLNICKLKW